MSPLALPFGSKVVTALGLTLFAATASAACSSSPGATPTPDAGPSAADAGADVAPAGAQLSVWVYTPSSVAGALPSPLAGAIVAYDPPRGAPRQEVTTGADGLAKLEGDPGAAGGMLTVAGAGHATITVLDVSRDALKALPPNGLGKPASDLVMVLPYTGADRTVALSGKVSGKQAADNEVTLSIRGLQDRAAATGSTYSLRAPKGQPLFLVGLEGKGAATGREIAFTGARFFKIEGPAPTADTILDLDVSQGTLPSAKSTFKVELPGGDSGPLGGSTLAFCQTQSVDSGLLLGITTKSAPSPDLASFGCEMLSATADIAPEALETLVAVQAADGAISISGVLGAAPDGTVWKDLLAPPALTIQSQKITDPILTEGLPKAATTCQLSLLFRNQLQWSLMGPFEKPCPASITIPAPPTGVTLPATVKGTLVGFADPVDVPGRKGEFFFKRVSVSRPFNVTTR